MRQRCKKSSRREASSAEYLPGPPARRQLKSDLRQFAAALPANHFSVVLEITERAMIDKNRSLAIFDWLHEQGFEIAIDDFGTGHSALIYLERYTSTF
ncbi:phage resistance protein [Raoultella terrigena]|uniref:Phage resistance protein n=1 Tax=Raoultella terrigena TaxID=577 RepID=A0A4U9CYN0_RAOTE|nr:phage resistance protein [Raoultella terrigena]